MDSVSSSSDEECDLRVGLVSDYSRLPQQPPNSQPMFDDPLSKFVHPISRAWESSPLVVPTSVSLSNKDIASDPDCLDAMMNSLSAWPYSGGEGPFRSATTSVAEDSGQGPADFIPAAQSVKGSQVTGRKRKKRRRASRRAPTTIMMTDTANFRTMVQEFTGIPATSLVPSHLHGAGIGLLGPNKLWFGSKLEPQLMTYNGLLGPFAPRPKSATFIDRSLSPQFTLPSDLGLIDFQSFARAQAPTDVAGECSNEPKNRSVPMAGFHDDRAVQSDANTRP